MKEGLVFVNTPCAVRGLTRIYILNMNIRTCKYNYNYNYIFLVLILMIIIITATPPYPPVYPVSSACRRVPHPLGP